MMIPEFFGTAAKAGAYHVVLWLVAILLFHRIREKHWAVIWTVLLGALFLPEVQMSAVSTEAPDQIPDRRTRGIDERAPESGEFEQTMKDYYAQTDVEGQGGIPKEPPDRDPMPLQHLEKPKHPPRHNM